MDIALWSASAVLAVVFLGSGIAKVTMPRDRLIATGQTGIAPFPMPVVRFVAVAEIAAAVGLLAPWMSGSARLLTPLAALGLVLVRWGAAVSHASLREPKPVAFNVGLLVLCGFVAAHRLAQLY